MWFKSHIGMAHLSQWVQCQCTILYVSLAIALGQTLMLYILWVLKTVWWQVSTIRIWHRSRFTELLQRQHRVCVFPTLFSALYMSNIIMVHLSWLMNQYWCLLAEVYPLFRWPYFSSNAPCLCQDSTQDPTLYLGFMSQAPWLWPSDLVFEEL